MTNCLNSYSCIATSHEDTQPGPVTAVTGRCLQLIENRLTKTRVSGLLRLEKSPHLLIGNLLRLTARKFMRLLIDRNVFHLLIQTRHKSAL